MRKSFLAFLVLTLLWQVTLQAQETVATGTVTDSAGNVIAGASVEVVGTKRGTVTDAAGKFSIRANNTQQLAFSAVGYQRQTAAVGAGISVVLQRAEQNALSEVVVTALGIRRDKKALGYAVSTVDKKLLEQRPDGDIARLLQGKAPGVEILSSSGISGSGTNIQIRGASSITGNTEPLWVVDGTPVNGSTNAITTAFYGNQTSSRFLDIDPNNVESISILKGLSATVLYGEQGRNGVILVTTKNGAGSRSKKKTEVSVQQSYFITQASSLPELQNSYGGGFSLTGGFSFFSNWGPKFTTPYKKLLHPYAEANHSLRGAFPDLWGDSIEFKPNDNFGAIFKKGHVLNTSVNVQSSLGNNSSISANYSRLFDQGFLETNNVKRDVFGVGFNSKLANNINIGATANYTINQFKSPSTSQAGTSGAQSGGGGIFGDVMYTPRANDLANWPYQTPDGASIYYRAANDIQNPLWTLYNSLNYQNTNRIYGNFNIKYDIIKNLSLMYRVGYDFYNEAHKLQLNKGGVTRAGELEYTKGIYRTVDVHNRIWDHSLIGQYNTSISSDLRFDVTAGFNSNRNLYDQTGVKSTEQLVFNLFDHSNFINQSSKAEDGTSDLDTYSDAQSIGVFAQAGLGFKEFFYVNIGGRNSWSSALEKENRSKFYPSGSISFIPTSMFESLKGNRVVDYIKLRGGYATSANFPPPYNTRPTLIVSTNDFSTRGNQTVNSNGVSDILPNKNLKPELLREIETGLEMRFFKSRLTFDLTLYRRIATDQILTRPLDATTGSEFTTINAGDLTNEGIELAAGVTPIRSRNFSWQVDANFTRNRSWVDNLPTGITQIQTGGLFSNIGNYAINGQPFGIMQGSYWQRDSKTGERSVGQDGYYIQSTDIRIIGNPNPNYRLNLINTLRYKFLEFRMQWDYSDGGLMYATSVNALMGRGLAKATDVDRTRSVILPGVKADGTPNDIQTSLDRAYFNTYLGAAEQFLYDATYIRLRELSLSMNFPEKWLSRTPLGAISFALTGQNLWHLAPNFPEGSNYDPETSSAGVGTTRGFEYMTGPQTRRMGATLKVTF